MKGIKRKLYWLGTQDWRSNIAVEGLRISNPTEKGTMAPCLFTPDLTTESSPGMFIPALNRTLAPLTTSVQPSINSKGTEEVLAKDEQSEKALSFLSELETSFGQSGTLGGLDFNGGENTLQQAKTPGRAICPHGL